jgi:hypothetical protein
MERDINNNNNYHQDGNDANNDNDNNGNNGNNNIINIFNDNRYQYYERNNNGNVVAADPDADDPVPDADILPIAMPSNMLQMLYELRVPLYALGAIAGGGGIHYDDGMEQAAAAVLARSLYDARPVKHVIDAADDESGEKHGIREMTFDPEMAEELKINTACGIWQEDFEKGEAIKVLPCNHAFKAEAITKWLTTEKAECPICRFKLESKEVIVRPDVGGNDDVSGHVYEDEDEMHQPQHLRPQAHPQPEIDEQRARENNIINRQNNSIHNRAHAGGAADMGRDAYYGISMPMNRLLQMRSGLIHGARVGGGGGSGGGAAAASPRSQPSQSQPSHPQPPPFVTNINNFYINRINQYHISAEEQEQADIEEAIRRSLQ